MDLTGTDHIGQQIRGTHHYAFRCGEWARVVTVVVARERPCFLVEFPDQVTDLWPVGDPANPYEFRSST